MIGFSYNGTHSRTYDIVARSVNRPLLPVLRKRELIIPGRHGVYDFNDNTYEKRIIEVEIRYVGTSLSELRSRARSIAAWLSGLGSTGKQLIFDDETSKYYTGKIYSEIGLQTFFVRGEATVLFECDPFAYDVDDICIYDETYEYDTGEEYDTGLIYPNCRTVYDWYFLAPYFNVRHPDSREWTGFPWSYNPHMTGLYNWGTVPTPLTITIYGDITNPRIYQETTSAELTISGSMTGGIMVINSDTMTVTLNSASHTGLISGTFPDLEVGANGFFFYGTAPHAEVTFSWNHRWL